MAEMRRMLLVLLYVSHSSASCGIQKTSVVETSEEGLVKDQEFPWVVSLQDSQYTHLAFGSILSEFWIISIASALQNRKDIIVIVGIAKMDAKVIAHEEYPVNTIIIHEYFDNETMNNNIALLKTDTAMQFSNLTGNHMTMSILRKISVKDINMCPLHKLKKTGCGNHIEQETDAVCLGDPGNPMMCQLQQQNLWVLRGVLSHGGEKCPGFLLYLKVEDYGDWITSKTKKTSHPLSAFHHWENLLPSLSYKEHFTVTQRKHSGLGQGGWSLAHVQGQKKADVYSLPANSSRKSPDIGRKGLRELGRTSVVDIQPMYYDYYGGDSGEGRGPISGQNRLHQPQELPCFSLCLFSFAMVSSLGANPPN